MDQDVASASSADFRPGVHLCCLHQNDAERQASLFSYLSSCATAGFKMLVITTRGGLERALRSGTQDLRKASDAGHLAVVSAEEALLKSGHFDPERVIRMLEGQTGRALDSGCPAMAISCDMDWVLTRVAGTERLIEFEARLNEHVLRNPCLAACRYDASRFPPGLLLAILATHPKAMIGGEVVENIYYVPTTHLLGSDPARAKLDYQLGRLLDAGRAQQALRDSEERFRALALNSDDCLGWHSPDGRLVWVSPAVERISGRSPEECLAMPNYPLPLIHETDRKRFDKLFRGWIQNRVEGQDVVVPILRKDDVSIWASFSWKPARSADGRHIGFQSSLRDITRFKQIEARTRFLEASMDCCEMPAFFLGPNGTVQHANKAACDAARTSSGALTGLRFDSLLTAGSRRRWPMLVERARQEGRMNTELKLRGRDDSGPAVLGVVLHHFIYDDKPCLFVIVRDSDKAAARSPAGVETAAILSRVEQQVRIPASVILGFSDMMAGAELSSEQRKCLNTISGHGQALLSLADDLAEYTRIEACTEIEATSDFDLRQTVGRTMQRVTSDSTAIGGLSTDWTVADDIPTVVSGTPGLLRRLLTRLLLIAARPASKGSLTVRVARPAEPRSGTGGLAVEFTVARLCPGAAIENVSEPLKPLDHAHESAVAFRHVGPGIDLAICRRIASVMSSRIEAAAEPGVGTVYRFTVMLGLPSSDRTAAMRKRKRAGE